MATLKNGMDDARGSAVWWREAGEEETGKKRGSLNGGRELQPRAFVASNQGREVWANLEVSSSSTKYRYLVLALRGTVLGVPSWSKPRTEYRYELAPRRASTKEHGRAREGTDGGTGRAGPAWRVLDWAGMEGVRGRTPNLERTADFWCRYAVEWGRRGKDLASTPYSQVREALFVRERRIRTVY